MVKHAYSFCLGVKELEKTCLICGTCLGEGADEHFCADCHKNPNTKGKVRLLKYPRPVGAIFLLTAGFIIKWQVLDMLKSAQTHQSSTLQIGTALIMFIPLFAIYGVCLLFGGKPAAEMIIRSMVFRKPGQPQKINFSPLTIAVLTAGLGLLAWFIYELYINGYSF